MQPHYVFIVGSFRSGTTLVRHILNSSGEISICPETQYFGYFVSSGYRKRIRRAGDLSNDTNVYTAVDTIYGFEQGAWRWLQRNVDKASFTKGLLETDRSDRAIFNLVMQLYGENKPILGEKTPSHLYHVPTLLDWFPNSKVIHTFRDPRAIFVSELKKKGRSKATQARARRFQQAGAPFVSCVLLQVTLTWIRCAHLHKKYKKRYSERYCLIRFEDLVRESEKQLELLTNFLAVDLTALNLEDVTSNSSFTNQRGKPGIDAGAADRWQEHIDPWVNRWFMFWCGKQLEQFGYT